METICGISCSGCFFKDKCKGCRKTNGKPLGGDCMVAVCCFKKGLECCNKCDKKCNLKNQAVNEVNELIKNELGQLKQMEQFKVEKLYELSGALINLEYTLPNGQKCKFLEDNRIYLGTQIPVNDKECYGISVTDEYIIISRYGENGENPKLVLIKERK